MPDSVRDRKLAAAAANPVRNLDTGGRIVPDRPGSKPPVLRDTRGNQNPDPFGRLRPGGPGGPIRDVPAPVDQGGHLRPGGPPHRLTPVPPGGGFLRPRPPVDVLNPGPPTGGQMGFEPGYPRAPLNSPSGPYQFRQNPFDNGQLPPPFDDGMDPLQAALIRRLRQEQGY